MPPLQKQPKPQLWFDEAANTAFLQLCASAKQAQTLHYIDENDDTDDESDCVIVHSGINSRLSHRLLRGDYDGLQQRNFKGVSLCAVQLPAGQDVAHFLDHAVQHLPLPCKDDTKKLAHSIWAVELTCMAEDTALTVPHLAFVFHMFSTFMRSSQALHVEQNTQPWYALRQIFVIFNGRMYALHRCTASSTGDIVLAKDETKFGKIASDRFKSEKMPDLAFFRRGHSSEDIALLKLVHDFPMLAEGKMVLSAVCESSGTKIDPTRPYLSSSADGFLSVTAQASQFPLFPCERAQSESHAVPRLPKRQRTIESMFAPEQPPVDEICTQQYLVEIKTSAGKYSNPLCDGLGVGVSDDLQVANQFVMDHNDPRDNFYISPHVVATREQAEALLRCGVQPFTFWEGRAPCVQMPRFFNCRVAKPEYWVQMQFNMAMNGLRTGIYVRFAECASMYVVVMRDDEFVQNMFAKLHTFFYDYYLPHALKQMLN
jgi:hypothetical protein